jgi:DNA-binding MurR/RpiR family transcriptional regulator
MGVLNTEHVPDAEPDGPSDYDSLVAVLESGYEALTPSGKKLASRLLTDPEGCAFLTTTDFAQLVDVNESTVVRFAKSLGLSGYPALVQICRARLRGTTQMVDRFQRLEHTASSVENMLESATRQDIENITRTFAMVDSNDWKRAVDTIARSECVYIIGLRKCYTVAYLLSFLLRLLREDVYLLDPRQGMLPEDLRRLGAGSAVVAISIHRYSRDTVRVFEYARTVGATTIALTDNYASPLARLADVTFPVDLASFSVLRSLTAMVSLTQALVADVAAELGKSGRSALLREEEILLQLDTYIEADGGSTPDAAPKRRPGTTHKPVDRAHEEEPP